MQLAQILWLLLAQEPVPHSDVAEGESLHPGHSRSPAPASSPNCLGQKSCLGAAGRASQHPKTPWGNSSSLPCACPRTMQVHGRVPPQNKLWRDQQQLLENSQRGSLQRGGGPRACRHHVAPLVRSPNPAAPRTQPGPAGKLKARERKWALFPCRHLCPCSDPRTGQGSSSRVLPHSRPDSSPAATGGERASPRP